MNNSNNSAILNLREAYVDSIGTINFSDDGFNGRVLIYLKPNCAIVPDNTYENIDWNFTLNKNTRLGESSTMEHQYSNSDKVRYRRGALTITSSHPASNHKMLSVEKFQIHNPYKALLETPLISLH